MSASADDVRTLGLELQIMKVKERVFFHLVEMKYRRRECSFCDYERVRTWSMFCT